MVDFLLTFLITVTCVWISIFDFRHYQIPLTANMVVMASGLAHAFSVHQNISVVIAAVVSVFCVLSVIRLVFYRLRGVVGLGLGDIIFCAGAATWIHIDQISGFIAFACVLALIGYLVLRRKAPQGQFRIAFAPYLCASMLVIIYSNALDYKFFPEGTEYDFEG